MSKVRGRSAEGEQNRMSMAGARSLWRSLLEDLRLARAHLIRNVLAGSAFTPRLLRWLIYWSCGLRLGTANISDNCIIANHSVEIAAGTFVNRGCYFEGSGAVKIGRDCQIGPEVAFITSHHDRDGNGHVDATPVPRAIVVQDRVWIGARAVILPGTVVESDCVIAAGAVVAGRCVSGQTYGGVPARPLRAS